MGSHALGGGASPLSVPLLTPAVSPESLEQDKMFSGCMQAMSTAMCERQTKALNAVVDRADFLEDMAMGCATCTDPWARSAPAFDDRYERHEREERHERHERKEKREKTGKHQHQANAVPTPSRARAGK